MINTRSHATQTSTHSSNPDRFLVVNADDFGFSRGVNQAIITAHQQGILTSTSLMVTGDAFEEAVTLAKANPGLAVGLHLVLGCGRSALPPEQIPHLVDAEGNFPNQPERAGLHYQFNAEARRELALEIRAQLEKFRQTGLPLSHVDGHLHLHCHPVVLTLLTELAEEFNIRWIRLPSEELQLALQIDQSNLFNKLLWAFVFGRLRRYGEKRLTAKGIRYTDRVYGLLQDGRITESYLLELIPRIRANLVEIYSHPAIAYPEEPKNGSCGLGFLEFQALLSELVQEKLANSRFELTNYQDDRILEI